MIGAAMFYTAATDDYTGFTKIIMYFGGDEIFAAEAPEYEKAFQRCGVKDYTIHVQPGLSHVLFARAETGGTVNDPGHEYKIKSVPGISVSSALLIFRKFYTSAAKCSPCSRL